MMLCDWAADMSAVMHLSCEEREHTCARRLLFVGPGTGCGTGPTWQQQAAGSDFQANSLAGGEHTKGSQLSIHKKSHLRTPASLRRPRPRLRHWSHMEAASVCALLSCHSSLHAAWC